MGRRQNKVVSGDPTEDSFVGGAWQWPRKRGGRGLKEGRGEERGRGECEEAVGRS